MNIYQATIGTRLELDIVNSIDEKTSQTYVSQLIDILDNENIIISCPIYESKYVFIALGSRIRATLFHNKHGLLSFTASISMKEKKDNILVLYLKILIDLEKIQRRKYYRFDCNLKAEYCFEIETETQNGKEKEKKFRPAITRNLSGSGSCIVIEESIPEGSTVELIVYLDGESKIKSICKVIRNSEITTTKGKKYEIGLYFHEISKKDQDVLVKYIFAQQRQLLKKNIY